MRNFLRWLVRHHACAAGRKEVAGYKTPQEFWEKTANYTYLAWVLDTISRDDESVKIRVLLCMYDGLMLSAHERDTSELKLHYEGLVSGKTSTVELGSWTTLYPPWANLKSRFLRNIVGYTWTRSYALAAQGDPCALIRKHFPTLPLNLGD